jgi:4-amino-4-deoxy-L-arabinose transferase-like glycosyltransferase
MPYWITAMIAATPLYLWVYVGVGVPWALALLPRRDWGHRGTVLALGFAVGSALLTVWMFLVAMIGAASGARALDFGVVAVGLAVLTLVGVGLMWWKYSHAPSERMGVGTRQASSVGTNNFPTTEHTGVIATQSRSAPPLERNRLLVDERLLIILMAAAFVVWWVTTAYWPFTAYDALWVYGYQGRLYTLLGYIPNAIGYYPQYLPLQYTFAQLAFGGIDDHTARAVLPFLQLGSILAVYVLGSRLFNRRTGIIAAALWTLYPHVGEWSRAGDLEIPVAFLFTLASAFILLAWTGEKPRRVYALIAGLILGVGLWTKPTMGAFVWGLGMLAALEFVHVRFDIRAWWARGQLILLTLLAAAPLGGVWYIRNVLLGHRPIDLPPEFWLTIAARSGQEFGWPLLALLVRLGYVYTRKGGAKPDPRLILPGLGLVLLALLPTILQPARLGALELLALALGVVLLAAGLIRTRWSADDRRDAAKVGWGLALALPYFVTWFYSYSYHYRLSFAIVPLMLLPTAVILARWLKPPQAVPTRILYLLMIGLLGLPGVISAVYDLNGGWDYLWTDEYPDDTARYRSGNPALMNVVDGFQAWIDQHPGETLRAAAPGIDRLPFFFPAHEIRVKDAPTQLSELEDVNYFVYGLPESRGEYLDAPLNAALGVLGRTDVARRAWGQDDGNFRYDVYELNLANRFTPPAPNAPAPDDVVIDGFARYLGHDLGGLELWPGRRVVFKIMWEVIAPAPEDYTIFIHLRDADGNLSANWDAPTALSELGYYSTLFWQPGEYIIDERALMLPEGEPPYGVGYELVIGMYDSSLTRLPITVNGEAAGDDYVVDNRMSIIPTPPG